MEHLNRETMARLVDESPDGHEAEHLAGCSTCRAELEALAAQTRALASLPEIRPPLGDWEFLEARLRSEGLVRDRGFLERLPLAQTPAWMRAAAAVALFAGGTVLGAGLAPGGPRAAGARLAAGDAAFVNASTVEDAAAALREAEQRYVTALTQYNLMLDQEGGNDQYQGDPSSRVAALEYLLAASQAAVRQAPADPFLNGLLATTRAERDATLRRISTRQDSWF